MSCNYSLSVVFRKNNSITNNSYDQQGESDLALSVSGLDLFNFMKYFFPQWVHGVRKTGIVKVFHTETRSTLIRNDFLFIANNFFINETINLPTFLVYEVKWTDVCTSVEPMLHNMNIFL